MSPDRSGRSKLHESLKTESSASAIAMTDFEDQDDLPQRNPFQLRWHERILGQCLRTLDGVQLLADLATRFVRQPAGAVSEGVCSWLRSGSGFQLQRFVASVAEWIGRALRLGSSSAAACRDFRMKRVARSAASGTRSARKPPNRPGCAESIRPSVVRCSGFPCWRDGSAIMLRAGRVNRPSFEPCWCRFAGWVTSSTYLPIFCVAGFGPDRTVNSGWGFRR